MTISLERTHNTEILLFVRSDSSLKYLYSAFGLGQFYLDHQYKLYMGVRGLKSFIERNDGLFVHNYRLQNTSVVIDANNLAFCLFIESQANERRDLFGGDMVQFGQYVGRFFRNLERCNLDPILVFDGAHDDNQKFSKTAEKQRRALERFQNVLSIARSGFGDLILPATTTNVLRSMALAWEIEMVQCMYEADLEVARIANTLRCPVISNDTDFYLMGIVCGVIPIDFLNHQEPIPLIDNYFIECKLFRPENFHKYLPNLNLETLPLLGVLAGNDFIQSKVFENLCNRMSLTYCGGARPFRKWNTELYRKILRILYFICDETLDEAVNKIIRNLPRSDRPRFRSLIKSNLEAYNSKAGATDFVDELSKIYRPGFYETHEDFILYGDNLDTEIDFYDAITEATDWLKRAMEQSVLTYRCLELIKRNTIFLPSLLDDPTLPSAISCLSRPYRVMLALLRSKPNASNSCYAYDREGQKYIKKLVAPMTELENYGRIIYTFFDLPQLDDEEGRRILLATFHSDTQVFDSYAAKLHEWFDHSHAHQIATVKILLDYIDEQSKSARLWKQFKQATLLCILYYFHENNEDTTFRSRLDYEDDRSRIFMDSLRRLVRNRRLDKMPVLGRKRYYNCRLMHQIAQLHSSILSFGWLNALLGDPLIRVKTEYWLNSCLIYNLAEGLRNRTISFDYMPEVVYNLPRVFRV